MLLLFENCSDPRSACMSTYGAEVLASADADGRVEACARAAKDGKLVVIADFDRTLTSCWVNGGRGSSAHGVLETAGVLSEGFQNTVGCVLL